jgi:hypothetical protein
VGYDGSDGGKNHSVGAGGGSQEGGDASGSSGGCALCESEPIDEILLDKLGSDLLADLLLGPGLELGAMRAQDIVDGTSPREVVACESLHWSSIIYNQLLQLAYLTIHSNLMGR